MTTEEKAIETLVWISEYIHSADSADTAQDKLLTILEKVETTLKGFEK